MSCKCTAACTWCWLQPAGLSCTTVDLLHAQLLHAQACYQTCLLRRLITVTVPLPCTIVLYARRSCKAGKPCRCRLHTAARLCSDPAAAAAQPRPAARAAAAAARPTLTQADRLRLRLRLRQQMQPQGRQPQQRRRLLQWRQQQRRLRGCGKPRGWTGVSARRTLRCWHACTSTMRTSRQQQSSSGRCSCTKPKWWMLAWQPCLQGELRGHCQWVGGWVNSGWVGGVLGRGLRRER